MRGVHRSRWFHLIATGAFAAVATGAFAQIFTEGETTHALQNVNNGISSGIDMHLESDVDFYINGFNVVGGGTWDPNISLNFNGGYFDNNTLSNGSYNLGDLISGSQDWYFGGFFGGMFGLGLLDTVALGTYTTDVEILGGDSDTAQDVLYSFTETVEIVDFMMMVSSPDGVIPLAPLGSTVIRHQLHNLSTNDFNIGSRYYSWSMPGIDQFDIDFSANYPFSVLAGEDLLVTHLDITAHADFANPFTFTSGIIGGWHSDDAVWLQAGEHTLTPVPEPTAMIGLGVAIASFAARRRKRN